MLKLSSISLVALAILFSTGLIALEPVAIPDTYTMLQEKTLTVGRTTISSLHIESGPDSWIGQGKTYDYSNDNGTFTARKYSGGVEIGVEVNGGSWSLDFVAPAGVPLQ